MIRVAAAQAGSVGVDTPATMAKLEAVFVAVAAAGAELVVFPEAFPGGYPKGHSFGQLSVPEPKRGGTDSAATTRDWLWRD